MKHRIVTGLVALALLLSWMPTASAGWTHGGDASDEVVTRILQRLETLLGFRQVDAPRPTVRPADPPKKSR